MTSKKSKAAVAAEIRHGSSLKFKRMQFTFEFLFPRRQSPLSTRSPAATWIALTIPEIGAESVVSIFIASVTISGVPW